MAKLTECDYCGEQLLDSSSTLQNWIKEPENELDFCTSECQSGWRMNLTFVALIASLLGE